MPTKLNVWSPIAAAALALGLFSIPPSLNAVSAQEQPARNLTVTGQGTVGIPTTLTEVRLGVEVQGKTAQEVQQEVARRSQAVVELLRSRNVEKLQTTGIQLNPVYRSNDNAAPTIIGYAASNIVSFRLSTDRAGTLLDEAVNAGATRIDGVNFIAPDEAMETARQQAIRAATQDALTQADTVLSALNFTRREIVKIQVNSAMPYPQTMYAMRDSAPNFSTPVMGGEQEISATVTLDISY
ncbi:SIMPL domain-containing protein [Laspinema sp. A4]|uniref:SIMPL domain-containing protein n=1 Tax=Laspinema sp. D2d TaxID=2953686 RepID=UPI0021BA6739|nr:SIMPL domain-containing protein [Laspinema sp. D2d]MCT7983900.1 SIMPL domain-containing protein [Laspinema sp. D2d]